MSGKKALLIIDVQVDFCPGGNLAVPEGSDIVPEINGLMSSGNFDTIVATKDWHPGNHKSFASNNEGKNVGDLIDLNGIQQVMWPDHCVQGTPGAEFVPQLDVNRITCVFTKGENPEVDSYSGFFDNGRRGDTGLDKYLKEESVTEVCIAGLATDYCVKFTALDAVSLGYKTSLFLDACRGVELNPGDVESAVSEMEDKGVIIIKDWN